MAYNEIKPDMNLGLCLAGGGGLGLLHIGLLEALEEKSIRPGIVTGTSSGAVIGAFYAAGKSADEVRTIFNEFRWTQIMAPPLLNRGLLSTRRMQDFYRKHLGEIRIEELPIRLKIASVNIVNGTMVGFTEGPLVKCLAAASAMPGFFEPVRVKDGIYYDAGGIYNLPLELFAGEGAKRIIAGNTIGRYGLLKKPRTAREIFYQAYLIRTMHLTAMRTGPKKWQGYEGEEVILIDYRTDGANPAGIHECAELIENTRNLSLEVLGEAF